MTTKQLLSLVVSISVCSGGQVLSQQAGLVKSHDGFVKAWLSGDVAALSGYMAEGARLFPESGGDSAGVRQAMRFVSRTGGGKRSELPVHRDVVESKTAAVITDVVRVKRSVRGRPAYVPLRRSVVWSRHDDAWRVLHLHQSPYTNFESSIAGFEAADLKDRPEPGGVVFVGSSSIRGWKSLREDFPGVETVHRGFGGSQLIDSILYAHRIITPYKPRKVVVYAGDNDVAAGKDAQRVLEDFKVLVRVIHEVVPEAEIGFIAIKPSLSRWQLWPEMKKANGLVADFAAKNPRLKYLDIAAPMLGADGLPRKELFVQDGLHMTPAGYKVWAAVVRPWVSR